MRAPKRARGASGKPQQCLGTDLDAGAVTLADILRALPPTEVEDKVRHGLRSSK